MGWKYNKNGAGVIVISYPKPFLHGQYKLEVNALNMDTQEPWITRKIIFVKYFSNCTRLDGIAQIISPCTFDLKLKCDHPVYPLSNFKALMYLTSGSDNTFAMIIPVDAVTLRERDDDRYDATVAYQHQLSKYAPLDLVFRSELYQEDKIENFIVQPLIKGASCNGEGSSPDPTAYQFLVPVTFYPTQTEFTAESFKTITKPGTPELPDNYSSTSTPLSLTTSTTNDPVSESSGSSHGVSVSSRPVLIRTSALCFIVAHLSANRAQV
ncbi:uncharacterized protein LOC131888739 [Tigriopus californicus]|nr:uncharacterized protein LOC131888739 [Tigriopus californicus]|eukprot:TCALIF_02620-PB protein Name:"Protein of unknown function" AED:0.12 eAED:0.11 QI:137/1/0.5/1/0/0/4/0/266